LKSLDYNVLMTFRFNNNNNNNLPMSRWAMTCIFQSGYFL